MSDDSLADRLERVRKRIAAACARVSRDPSGVRLVAVTKTFGPEMVAGAMAIGLKIFGENRVQEAGQKIPLCPGDAEWHLVGHLQRNKAKNAVELFRMIHSIDSLRVLEAVDRAAEAKGVMMPVCIEVNVSGESSKFGVPPEAAGELVEQANRFRYISVVGLMTVPPFSPEPENARPFFRRLRELRDSIRTATGIPLEELSMGMSNDFEVAVEEGATWIRLGTVLFGVRGSPWRPAGADGPGSEAGEVGA